MQDLSSVNSECAGEREEAVGREGCQIFMTCHAKVNEVAPYTELHMRPTSNREEIPAAKWAH